MTLSLGFIYLTARLAREWIKEQGASCLKLSGANCPDTAFWSFHLPVSSSGLCSLVGPFLSTGEFSPLQKFKRKCSERFCKLHKRMDNNIISLKRRVVWKENVSGTESRIHVTCTHSILKLSISLSIALNEIPTSTCDPSEKHQREKV